MPYRHVALYRWAGHVDDEHVARVATALDELAGRVPGVRGITHGADIGLSGGGFDYLVVIDVDSVVTWRSLRDHPAYILLVEELFTGHVLESAAGQLRVDEAAVVSPDDMVVRDLTDDELMAHARRAAQAGMDALLAEPDEMA